MQIFSVPTRIRPAIALVTSVAALSTLTLVLPGCGGGTHLIKDRAPETLKTGSTPTRVFNGLLTDTGTLTVNVTAPQALQAKILPTGGVTAYADVPAGDLSLSLMGSDSAVPAIPALPATVGDATDYTTDQSRTLVVFGTPNSSDTTNIPQVYVLTDPAKLTSIGATSAAIRVVSVAPNLGPFDLYDGASPVLGATRITFESPTSYTQVTAGDIAFSLHDSPNPLASPTPEPSPTPAPLAPPTFAQTAHLNAGQSYTIFVFGQRGKNLDAVVVPEP